MRHFGEVFTFPVVSGEIPIFDGLWVGLMARAERDFFKEIDFLDHFPLKLARPPPPAGAPV